MIFGPMPLGEAVGAIAAHTLKVGDLVLKKGTPVTEEHARLLSGAGIDSIVAARLGPDDVGEDVAAERIAAVAAGAFVQVGPSFTGRANLFAERAGLLLIDVRAIDEVNAIDEAVTIATLPAFKPVVAGEMIATIKVIPYAAPLQAVEEAVSAAKRALAVGPYRLRAVGVVSTVTPGFKPTIITKTVGVLRERLAPTGAVIVAQAEAAHETAALALELRRQIEGPAELIIVFGASAIADRRDVVPAGIEEAGGHVEHFGMPVDPGNLLLIGRIGDVPVIGAPGCARSPVENGFDWVLHRLLAGLTIGRAEITRLGVGGLLMEIVSRPQPRGGGAPIVPDES